MILVSTLFEMKVIIATEIRREKSENYVEFSFHSISGLNRVNISSYINSTTDFSMDLNKALAFTHLVT